MSPEKKIIIEVICKDRGHWPSFYMHAAINDILPEYGEAVNLRVVNIRERKGKERLLELSCALYGKDAVFQQQRLAPIPSMFIDGELVFDAIPDRDELTEAIESRLGVKGVGHED